MPSLSRYELTFLAAGVVNDGVCCPFALFLFLFAVCLVPLSSSFYTCPCTLTFPLSQPRFAGAQFYRRIKRCCKMKDMSSFLYVLSFFAYKFRFRLPRSSWRSFIGSALSSFSFGSESVVEESALSRIWFFESGGWISCSTQYYAKQIKIPASRESL